METWVLRWTSPLCGMAETFLDHQVAPSLHMAGSFSAFTAACVVLGPGISASHPLITRGLCSGWGSTSRLSWPEMEDTDLTCVAVGVGCHWGAKYSLTPSLKPSWNVLSCQDIKLRHLNCLNLGYQFWLQSLYLRLKEKNVHLHSSSMWLRREVWVNLDLKANLSYP